VQDDELARIDELAGEGPARVALEQLGEEEREAVVQRVLLEREYEQIAADSGQSQAAVRKRVSRGLERMRKRLGDGR
jgi:DNA-directed RNA polymerase specialized sigma24 family protein